MSAYPRSSGLLLAALAVVTAFSTITGKAQTGTNIHVEGYLCREPVHAEEFQQLASSNPGMTRPTALWRFNRTRQQPRCQWYARTQMLFKGPLRESGSDEQRRSKRLFLGGNGGLFEVLVFETPESAQTLYSWRRTRETSG